MLFFFYIIIATIIVGLLFYQKITPRYIRLFIPFLALTLFVEIANSYNWLWFKGPNLWFFNIFTIIEFIFYFFIFYFSIKNHKIKKLVLFSIPFYVLAACINIFFIQGIFNFHTISYRIASVMIIIYCYLYFRQLLKMDISINILRDPMFWICTGLLFFYSGFFFYFSAFEYIAYTKSVYNLTLWKILSRSLNILLYSSFFIALICNLKQQNLSKSL